MRYQALPKRYQALPWTAFFAEPWIFQADKNKLANTHNNLLYTIAVKYSSRLPHCNLQEEVEVIRRSVG